MSPEPLRVTGRRPLVGEVALPPDGLLALHAVACSGLFPEGLRLANPPPGAWFGGFLERCTHLGIKTEQREGALVCGPAGDAGAGTQTGVLEPIHEIELMAAAGLASGTGRDVRFIPDAREISSGTRSDFARLFALDPEAEPGSWGWAVLPPEDMRLNEKPLPPYFKKIAFLYSRLYSGAAGCLEIPETGPDELERFLAHRGFPVSVKGPGTGEMDELERRAARRLPRSEQPLLFLEAGGERGSPRAECSLPGDSLAASALALAATLCPGSDVRLRGILLNPARCGFLTALRRMGADLEIPLRRETQGQVTGDVRVRASRLRGRRFDVSALASMRDEAPLLLVAAALAEGETVIRDLDFLRGYDRDLLKHMVGTFRSRGVETGEIEDGVVMRGQEILDGTHLDGAHHSAVGLGMFALALVSGGESTLTGCGPLLDRFPDLPELAAAAGS